MRRLFIAGMTCTENRVARTHRQHTAKSLGTLLAPDDTRDCSLALQSVSQADPNVYLRVRHREASKSRGDLRLRLAATISSNPEHP